MQIIKQMSTVGEEQIHKQQEDRKRKLIDMKKDLNSKTKDWDLVENTSVKNFPRLAHRIKVGYNSSLNFETLVVNKPPHRLPAIPQSHKYNRGSSEVLLTRALSGGTEKSRLN